MTGFVKIAQKALSTLLLAAMAASCRGEAYDLLLQNVLVVDGSGEAAYRDIGLV